MHLILSPVPSLSFKIESQQPPLTGFFKCSLQKFSNTSLYDLLSLGPHIQRSSLTCTETKLIQAPEATHLYRKAYKTSANSKLWSWLLCQDYLLVFHLFHFQLHLESLTQAVCCTAMNSKWHLLSRHLGKQKWKFLRLRSIFCAALKSCITCFWKIIRNLR